MFFNILLTVSVYRLRCSKNRFYRVWNKCYGHYHRRSSCFGRLSRKHLFSSYTPGTVAYYALLLFRGFFGIQWTWGMEKGCL